MAEPFPIWFSDAKITLVAATGLTRDALHIYAALGIFILVKLLWRGRGGTVAALLLVAAAALANEWLDHRVEMLQKIWCNDEEHWHDIWNTLFWPVMLAVVLPWLPSSPRGKNETAETGPAEMSGEDAERRLEQA